MIRICGALLFLFVFTNGIELPAGLRPAKAVGEIEKPIIPGVNDPQVHERDDINIKLKNKSKYLLTLIRLSLRHQRTFARPQIFPYAHA